MCACVFLLSVKTNAQRKVERERVVRAERVDVTVVRSANEAAENQSFLRTTGSACLWTEQ